MCDFTYVRKKLRQEVRTQQTPASGGEGEEVEKEKRTKKKKKWKKRKKRNKRGTRHLLPSGEENTRRVAFATEQETGMRCVTAFVLVVKVEKGPGPKERVEEVEREKGTDSMID